MLIRLWKHWIIELASDRTLFLSRVPDNNCIEKWLIVNKSRSLHHVPVMMLCCVIRPTIIWSDCWNIVQEQNKLCLIRLLDKIIVYRCPLSVLLEHFTSYSASVSAVEFLFATINSMIKHENLWLRVRYYLEVGIN